MDPFSPRIGRIWGIDIELHWSFILLLLLIFVLSLYLFAIWVILFACVLVHELFHSITSKRNGIKVKKIVLYPFGGGSIIDFERVSPELELKISLVGPIASLLLAALFGIANIFTPPGIISSTVQTVFILNLFLGVFNILPWLPLDGGRALRAYLQKSRSFLASTRTAVKVSNAVTALFVIGTIAYALLAHGYSASYREFIVVFDVVIAFFIYGGAQAELQSALIKAGSDGLLAKDAMSGNFRILQKNVGIGELYRLLTAGGSPAILIKDGKNLKLLSHSSLKKLMDSSKNRKAVDIAEPVPVVNYRTGLYSVLEKMRMEESWIAAVEKNRKIIGIVSSQQAEAVISLRMARSPGNQRRMRG